MRLLQPEACGSPYQLVATLDQGIVVAASVLPAAPARSQLVDTPSSTNRHASQHVGAPPGETGSAAMSPTASAAAAAAAAPAAVAAGSGNAAKKRPGSGLKAAHGATQEAGPVATSSSISSSQIDSPPIPTASVPESQEPCECSAAATEGPRDWGALCVSTPQGLVVQLSTDGCVLLTPVETRKAQVGLSAASVPVSNSMLHLMWIQLIGSAHTAPLQPPLILFGAIAKSYYGSSTLGA